MKHIAIIDYRLSNLFSVKHALELFNVQASITSDPREIQKADGLILPGVGAFGDAMKNLNKLKLSDVIVNVIASGKPFMGVCLGLQLLFDKSSEFGHAEGLHVLKGNIEKIPAINMQKKRIKIPHMGWNKLFYETSKKQLIRASPLGSVPAFSYMYFVHSYTVVPKDPHDVIATTEYMGYFFCAAVLHKNIFAVQFHPEKSGEKGLSIYKNWLTSLSYHYAKN